MEWFLIAVSVIVLWIASIYKILNASSSFSNSTFFNNGGGTRVKKSVLMVLAHPDDESMFFSPTINCLTSVGYNIHILCLSIGNADGIGNVRQNELLKACAVHQIPIQQVKVLDHPNLQDGFGQIWDHNLLVKIIEEEVSNYQIDVIITFDGYGVSGHCNHRDVHHGVRNILKNRSIEAWELVSTNIFRKYSGPADIWLSLLFAANHENRAVCFLNQHPLKTFRAMAQHYSQWVWFRKLFVSFSSYTYVNTLRKMH